MKRRIVLMSIVAGVVLLVGGGILLYLRQNTDPKILAKGETALKAGDARQALEHANTYIQNRPNDYRGHWLKGRALMVQGRYDDARAPIKKAIEGDPSDLNMTIALSDTYATPAIKNLSDREKADSAVALRDSIEGLKEAVKILAITGTPQNREYLRTQEARGVNYNSLATAQNLLNRRLERDARTAEAGGALSQAKEYSKAAAPLLAEARESQDRATSILLDVLKADATSALGGKTLINLADQRGDKTSLKQARDYILALKTEDRPAIPTTLLAMYEVKTALDAAQKKQKVAWAIPIVDGVLQHYKDHPAAKDADEDEVKIDRIWLAWYQSDWKTVESLCGEILKKNKNQQYARWFLARLMMMRNQWQDAERELEDLKTSFPQFTDAFTSYAEVALHNGKEQQALEALRRVTNLNTHASEAWRMLVQTLLKESWYDKAYEDAQKFYSDQNDHPLAIVLFAESAKLSGRSESAYKALSGSIDQNKDNATVLSAIATGLVMCDRKGEAVSLAEKVAKIKPDSEGSFLAVANAMVIAGREADARSMLQSAIIRYSDSHKARYELGKLYARSGNPMQALEQYQQAIAMDATNTDYLLETAKAHLSLGMIDAADDDCARLLSIDPVNSAGALLRGQIRISRGLPLDSDQAPIKSGIGTFGGLGLAVAYLNHGSPLKCIELCREELKKSADNTNALLLLGQAHLAMGETDRSIEQWAKVIRISPTLPAPYSNIARALAPSAKPDAIRNRMSKIPSADANIVDVMVAGLYRQNGDFPSAQRLYADVSNRDGAPDDMRSMAALLSAKCLADGGKVDAALAEMDSIKTTPSWTHEILLEKAGLLARTGKKDQAARTLDKLRQSLSDTATMRQMAVLARLYAAIDRSATALEICKQLQDRYPHDARPYLLQGEILVNMERADEAIACYRKAIQCQGDNLDAYRVLSRVLDTSGDRLEAMKVLKQLEKLGAPGLALSLKDQASLYASYGLYEQSAQCLQRRSKMDEVTNSADRLDLGRSFVALGRTEDAAKTLNAIPQYAPQYVEAQQLLAKIAPGDDERLAVLRKLRTYKPDNLSVLGDEMSALLAANRLKEAADTFESYVKTVSASKPLPPAIAYMGMRAMLAQGMTRQAKELSLQMAKQTSASNWRGLALLLASQDNPKEARAMLGEPAACKDFTQCLVGLSLGGSSEQTDAWYGQLQAIEKRLAVGKAPGRVPPSAMLLAAVAAGKIDDAKAVLVQFPPTGDIGKGVAAQLVSAAAQARGNSAAQAMKLIRAGLAMQCELPTFGRQLAMDVFKADPSCQWAAGIVIQGGAQQELVEQVLAKVQPQDCGVALLAKATLLADKPDYKQAAEAYSQIAASEQNNVQFLFDQGRMLENAGDLPKALVIYQKVMSMSKDPVAKNNAAYVQAQLAGNDQALLQKAQAWSQAAVDAYPQAAAFHDTLGWIMLRNGQKQDACRQLRLAIKGLQDSPESHYHLAMAEAACGNDTVAKWHFQAAVAAGKRAQEQKQAIPAGTAKAIELAKAQLANQNDK